MIFDDKFPSFEYIYSPNVVTLIYLKFWNFLSHQLACDIKNERCGNLTWKCPYCQLKVYSTIMWMWLYSFFKHLCWNIKHDIKFTHFEHVHFSGFYVIHGILQASHNPRILFLPQNKPSFSSHYLSLTPPTPSPSGNL